MIGPDHYLDAERYLRLAEDLYLNGSDEEVAGAGQLAAAIAQGHAQLATAAAAAELDADEGPGGGSATGRSAEAGREWARVLVHDPDPELVCAGGALPGGWMTCGRRRPCPDHDTEPEVAGG